MTQVSYIAGLQRDAHGRFIGRSVPAGEAPQRAGQVKPADFIEYTALSQGEMQLALLREKARIYRDFYGDAHYQRALDMVENALYRGVHGGVAFLGYIPTELQPVARAISQAVRRTAPASRGSLLAIRPGGLRAGVRIGDPIIPLSNDDCEAVATALANKRFGKDKGAGWYKGILSEPAMRRYWKQEQANCENRKEVQRILNAGMEKSGHHLLYGYLPNANSLPQLVSQKIQNQLIAQEDLARVAEVPVDLVQRWLDVGIMRNNAQVAGTEPWNQSESNLWLTMLPEAGRTELAAVFNSKSKWSNPLSVAVRGQQFAAILKKYSQPAVGVGDPVTIAAVTALVGAISKLVADSAKFAAELKGKRSDALAAANGFGSNAFGPQAGDYDQGAGNNGGKDEPSDNSDMLLLGGAAVAAYMLLK